MSDTTSAPPGSDTAARAGTAGLAASATATVALALLHLAAPSVPFAPLALAQGAVRLVPGSIATFFIDLLGHVALPLAGALAAAAFLLAGGLLGRLAPRVERWTRGNTTAALAIVVMPLWAACTTLYPADRATASRAVFAAATLVPFLAGSVVGARVSRPPESDGSRRRALRWIGLGAAGMVLGAAGGLLRRRPDPGERALTLPGLQRTPPAAPNDPTFARIEGLTQRVTPLRDFYVVDGALLDPDIDPAQWRLQLGGLVDRTLALSHEELAGMPTVERFQTLECISNPVGGDLISTARWAGVPLAAILERAGVRTGAVEVVFSSADGYSDSLTIEQATDPRTLIVLGMNGRVLPRSHGFPARLLSVGTYGMKNPKWLTSISVVDHRYDGYWERRGWSKEAIVKTGTRIDTPTADSIVDGPVDVAGVAFAGDRGIAGVEVSADGSTWQPAILETPVSPLTWARWRYRWTPEHGGAVVLTARAVDGTGKVQTDTTTGPHPDGSSGHPSVSLSADP